MSSGAGNESSAVIRERVCRAREIQVMRYGQTGLQFNADLGVKELEEFCKLGNREKKLMESLFEKLHFTARSYHRLLKVARTIADLEAAPVINEKHLSEAVSYRGLDEAYERR